MPSKLIVALLAGAVVVFYFLPRRAEMVGNILSERGNERRISEVKKAVVERIQREICAPTDLCAYEALQWNEISPVDSIRFTVVHTFRVNSEERRYLFQATAEKVDEVHRIR